MDLFVIAVSTRSLMRHWAETRGDWQTVDRLAAKGGRKQEPEGFTPFRLDLIRDAADAACEARVSRGAGRAPHSRPGLARMTGAIRRLFSPRRQPAAC